MKSHLLLLVGFACLAKIQVQATCNSGEYPDVNGDCQLCGCNVGGSVSPNCTNGVCECHDTHFGANCLACKAGPYYKLDFANLTETCKACDCDPNGSVTTFSCLEGIGNGDPGGQCSCKSGFGGRTCSDCASEFHRVNASDPSSECIACSCNAVGSENLNCDSIQCDCKPGYSDEKCASCAEQYYRVDAGNKSEPCIACNCSATGSSELNCNSTQCSCKDGYRGLTCEECEVEFYRNNPSNVSEDCKDCECNVVGRISNNCTQEQCDCKTEYDGVKCEKCAATYYRDDPTNNTELCKECNCNVNGSNNLNCTEGECDCKTGYAGLKCGDCADEYYRNLTSGNCEECACDSVGRVNNSCTEEQCFCQPEYDGLKCDECLDEYYRNGDGLCEACGCNDVGRVNNSCTSEQCFCLQGYDGLKCAECANDYFRNATSGYCEACGCNAVGSEFLNCTSSAICDCKDGHTGDKCDECRNDYYRTNPNDKNESCLACGCSIHAETQNCSSGGICDCQPPYSGDKCELCIDKYYKNDFSNYSESCKSCNCTGDGVSSELCTSEQCDCYPGYTGLKCDECADGFTRNGSSCNTLIIWSEWSEWTDCSETCEAVGQRNRSRTCLQDSCESKLVDTPFTLYATEDSNQNCDRTLIDCGDNFEPWSDWSECSGTCGFGTTSRSRTCNETKECVGPLYQSKRCFSGCRKTACPSYPPFPGECNFEDDCGSEFGQFNSENLTTSFFEVASPSLDCPPTTEPTFNNEGCGRFMKLTRNETVQTNLLWSPVLYADGRGQCVNFHVAVISEETNAMTDMQVYIKYLNRSEHVLIYSDLFSTNSTWEHVQVSVNVDVADPYIIIFVFNETDANITYGDVGIDEFRVENGNCTTRGWSEWGEWSCNATCGNGTETRTRVCLSNGNCVGDDKEEQDCESESQCEKSEDGIWSAWSFSSCSETCGDGTRTRTRVCYSRESEYYNEQVCKQEVGNIFGLPLPSHAETDVVSCNLGECDGFSQWSDWSSCSGTCGSGTKSRSRTCEEGRICDGPYQKFAKCDDGCRVNECPNYRALIDCNFDAPEDSYPEECVFHDYAEGDEGAWDVQGASNGSDSGPSGDKTFSDGCGKFMRLASSSDNPTSFLWTPTVDSTEDKFCLRFTYSMVTTQNSSMGNLTVYQHFLSKRSNGGSQYETLHSHNGVTMTEWKSFEHDFDSPSNESFVIVFKYEQDGNTFSDIGIDDFQLMDQSCSDNYTQWSAFGECNQSCDGGNQTRTRVCIDKDSIECTYNEIYYDYQACNEQPCPVIINGNWTVWTEKTACNATCENRNGVIVEYRNCTNPAPENGGKLCLLSNQEFPLRGDYEERCVDCHRDNITPACP